jgi:hypothetical protein
MKKSILSKLSIRSPDNRRELMKSIMVWQQQTTQQYPLHTWSPLNGASHFKLKFEEYTYIIKGKKQFIEEDTIVLEAGQSIKIEKNTRVQYSNPFDEPCGTLPYALLHLTLTKFIAKNKRNCQELFNSWQFLI